MKQNTTEFSVIHVMWCLTVAKQEQLGFMTFKHSPKKKTFHFTCSCFTAEYHSYRSISFLALALIIRAKNSTLTPFTIAFDGSLSQCAAEGCSQMAEFNARSWHTPPRQCFVHTVSYMGKVRRTNRSGTLPKCGQVHMCTHPTLVCKNTDIFTRSQSPADVKQTDS